MNTFIILTLKLIFVAVELLDAFLRLRKFACVSSLFRNERKENIMGGKKKPRLEKPVHHSLKTTFRVPSSLSCVFLAICIHGNSLYYVVLGNLGCSFLLKRNEKKTSNLI